MPAATARTTLAAAATLAALAACVRRGPTPARPAGPHPEPAAAAPPLALTEADLTYLGNRALAMPVAGARAWRVPPSFTEPRSGGRVHEAVDIMAPRGTPVVAADEGRVWKLRSNPLGGITVYATDPLERFVYYYAHLDAYRAGLFEGQPLFRGDTLGFVGTTGNAPRDVPHLHFQISRVARDGQWWGGTPVDPLPYLRAAEVARADARGPVRAVAGAPGERSADRIVRPTASVRPGVPADPQAEPASTPR
jgi:murein DD-endopeptidase MepM/ murein hydrolase activator NlpD